LEDRRNAGERSNSGDGKDQRVQSLMIMMMKKKAISLQTWTGPAGSRRLRLPDFKKFDT